MSSASESSERSRTLPRAELNPLVNPILAENMGRWAEVYFTSPPEKREAAVIDLLRELETEHYSRHAVAPASQAEPIQTSQTPSPAEEIKRESSPPVSEILASCSHCGHDNPVTHPYCGMCGCSVSLSSPEEFRTDGPYDQHAGEMESVESNLPPEPMHQAVPESYGNESRPSDEEFRPTDNELRSDPYDLSMLQGLRDREIDDYEYEEPSSPQYRYYVGAVLAILLLLLAYKAWRGGQTSQSSRQAALPPPPGVMENAPPVKSTTAEPIAGTHSKPAKSGTPAASSSSGKVAEQRTAESASHPSQIASQNPVVTGAAPTTAAAEPPLTQGGGTEELAMAQRYLTGSKGETRDSGEAVKWLWKAIAKHNGPATLQLADLYLKGDGVSKNCDQARVLLDSAARRGMTGAGDRLRNLPAFGCQ